MRSFISLFTLMLSATIFLNVAPHNTSATERLDGEKIFKRCKTCHQIGAGAKNRVGPHLNVIGNRIVGSVENFKYSKSLLELKKQALRWDRAMLDKYLKAPRKFIQGTSMNFSGIKDKLERQKIIEYIWQASESSKASSSEEYSVSAEILSIAGDRDYGEYLSSECTTCHQASGKDEGIPSITNWPVESFIIALHAYKNGHRKHPIMEMISKRLSDEEIASLAIFFNSINN